ESLAVCCEPIPGIAVNPLLFRVLYIKLQTQTFGALQKTLGYSALLPGPFAHVEQEWTSPIPDVPSSKVIRFEKFYRCFLKTFAHVTGNMKYELGHTCIFFVNRIKIFGFQQRVNTVDRISVKEREPLLAIAILILEERDLICQLTII